MVVKISYISWASTMLIVFYLVYCIMRMPGMPLGMHPHKSIYITTKSVATIKLHLAIIKYQMANGNKFCTIK